MATKNIELFESAPVTRSVLTLVIPAVLSQLVAIIYNMVDTFFIGRLNDPFQVAAVTTALPLFMFLTGISNLFGIGGASLVSRALGVADYKTARTASAFSIYCSFIVAFGYGITLYMFSPLIFPRIGSSAETYDYIKQYTLWATSIGAIPTVLSSVMAHLLRAVGDSKRAGFGIVFGGILNILIDPLFIFKLGFEIKGAAMATLISNIAVFAYFTLILYRKYRQTTIWPNIRYLNQSYAVAKEVLSVGLASFTMQVASTTSNMILNGIVANYSSAAIAGMGIAKKISLVTLSISQGISQGALPLIAYNYSSRNYSRMASALRTTLVYSLSIAIVFFIFLSSYSSYVITIFISNTQTVEYGTAYLHVIALSFPLTAINCVAITTLQAIGRKTQPFIISILRKGGVEIPLIFLLNHFLNLKGLPWSAVLSELVGLIFSALFLAFMLKNVKNPVKPKTK